MGGERKGGEGRGTIGKEDRKRRNQERRQDAAIVERKVEPEEGRVGVGSWRSQNHLEYKPRS